MLIGMEAVCAPPTLIEATLCRRIPSAPPPIPWIEIREIVRKIGRPDPQPSRGIGIGQRNAGTTVQQGIKGNAVDRGGDMHLRAPVNLISEVACGPFQGRSAMPQPIARQSLNRPAGRQVKLDIVTAQHVSAKQSGGIWDLGFCEPVLEIGVAELQLSIHFSIGDFVADPSQLCLGTLAVGEQVISDGGFRYHCAIGPSVYQELSRCSVDRTGHFKATPSKSDGDIGCGSEPAGQPTVQLQCQAYG